MPLVLLQFPPYRGLDQLAHNLAKALPEIVAPNLNVEGREDGEGKITSEDIIVWCVKGDINSPNVNFKDLQITIFVHPYEEREANIDERRKAIAQGIRAFLADYDRNVTGFVQLIRAPISFEAL